MNIAMAWSGGKDSAVALAALLEDPSYQVTGLLTTVNGEFERISMHGVRQSLLEAQAEALGLPLHRVVIPYPCNNGEYEAAMGNSIGQLKAQGVEAMGFGDLFLEDIRAYREKMLAPTGLTAVFPLWGQNTAALAGRLLEQGFRARLCCVDPKALSAEFAGREYDQTLLADLPEGVDPCGENGEFHTFVYDGPNFTAPLRVEVGERVERDGFWFADLIPAAGVEKVFSGR